MLHYAVDGGHPDIVSMLLLTGQGPWPAAMNSTPPAAVTALLPARQASPHPAGSEGDAADGRVAPPEDCDERNGGAAFTPLHLAARRGHAHLLPQLLRCGMDSRAVDGRGRTVLHHATLGAGEAASTAQLPPMLSVARGAGGSQPPDEAGDRAVADGGDPAGERQWLLACVRTKVGGLFNPDISRESFITCWSPCISPASQP